MKPLLASLLVLATTPAAAPPPASGGSWEWNARERTAAGARALAAGDAERAAAAFDVAQRLRPHDPRSGYNAGTARIGSDDARAAALLDAAARAAAPELAPDAWYNLGTARLASGDARGAVAALTETLRRVPGRADAKQNLELALAELERQQQEESKGGGDAEPQRRDRDGGSGDGEPNSDAGQDESERDPTPEPGDQEDDRAGSPGEGSGSPDPRNSAPRERPLPQFRDLPDMTAEQAAAILRAVEDLERQQRRERAQRAAAQRATAEIDW